MNMHNTSQDLCFKWSCQILYTNEQIDIYTLTSVCIFSLLFSMNFLSAGKENFFNNQEVL